MSHNKKFEVDPRILANTQKILQYLSRMAEEQQKLKQAVRMTMSETQKFQSDVYQSFRILDNELQQTRDNMESLHEVTDHINSRVKSIHRHVKGFQSNQEFGTPETDNTKMLNTVPRMRQNQMGTSSRLPKTAHGFELPSKGRRLPIERYAPNNGHSDTDTDENALGATGGMTNSLNSNLLQRAPVGATAKASNQPGLSPLVKSETSRGQHQIQSPNIQVQEPENQTKSPVAIANQPPKDTFRPHTRRETSQPGVFDVSAIKRVQRTKRPLVQAKPQEQDIRIQVEGAGIEMSPNSVTAITNTCNKGNVTASRTVGLHTMLVLDVSRSMAGDPLDTMKTYVNSMLDCIDSSAGEYGLEEHIAMVTCGASVEVEQPFTNDFMAVRTKLDNLSANGRTPLLTALAMALFYLEINGESVEMFKHRIPPRLIVVSDFQVTNDSSFTGADADSSEDRIMAKQQIFKVAAQFRSRGYPVLWVPVGESDQFVCRELCKRSQGTILKVNKPETAGNFYRYQTIIGSAMNQYDSAQEVGREENISLLIQQLLPQVGLSETDVDAVEKLMEQTLERSDDEDDIDEISIENDVTEEPPMVEPRLSPSHGRPRIETPTSGNEGPNTSYPATRSSATDAPPTSQTARTPTPRAENRAEPGQQAAAQEPAGSLPFLPEWVLVPGLDQVGFEERGDLPLIGSRVVRGKDWKWDNQDGKGPGTVVGHKDKGLVFIVWDNTNTIGIFRYRYEGDKFDVQVINDARSLPDGMIDIGCWVIRGPDWTKGDEDGGNGTVGVVIRKLPNRVVQVRWPSRVIESYNFGNNNKWDLKVTMTKSLPDFQSVPSEAAGEPEDSTAQPDMTLEERPTVPGKEDQIPVWSWRDVCGNWRAFPDEAIAKIQTTYEKNPEGQCMVHRDNISVKVFLGQMQCEARDRRTSLMRGMTTPSELKSVQEANYLLGTD